MPPSRFDCAVCAGDKPSGQRLACPACAFEACKDCQKTYLLPQCMACRVGFTRAFLIAALGRAWVNGPLRTHLQDRLMERERALLPDAMLQVSAVREHRDYAERMRHRDVSLEEQRRVTLAAGAAGAAGAAAALRAMHTIRTAVIPCPVDACRGFLDHGRCGVCLTPTCLKCLRPQLGGPAAGHTCDPDDVASVAMLARDSRPCPNCGVFIHRTHGCNHMHCTHCNVHWDWESRKVLTQSTNGHYNRLQAYARDVATIGAARRDDGGEGGACGGRGGRGRGAWDDFAEVARDGVPLDAQPLLAADRPPPAASVTASDLRTALYEDAAVVRFTASKKYDPDALRETHASVLARMRTSYVMQEMDEATWRRRLFQNEMACDRDLHHGLVFAIYLSTVNDLQRRLHRTAAANPSVPAGAEALEVASRDWRRLVRMCNDSFDSLREEYGGPRIAIREDVRDADVPPLDRELIHRSAA